MKAILFVVLLVSSFNLCASSKVSVSDLITASQAEGANSQLFKTYPDKAGEVDVDGFVDSREFNVRRGVPNFMRKCHSQKSVKVAFIGSITKSDNQYRNQTANYIAQCFLMWR